MALINPCDIEAGSVSNTGIECSASMGVAKGMFLVPAGYSWTETDMADTMDFINARIHATPSSRFYPILQGIFDMSFAQESDVTEANPIAGTTDRIRAGGFTFTYTYKDGGICLAKALRSFQNKGYRAIFVDQVGQIQVRKNADGTYSGLKVSDISNSISPATSTTKYKNTLVLGVSQDEYINYSEILKPDVDITDVNGLIDVEITKAAAASTTKLKIGVRTHCAKTNLIATYGNAIADLDLFIVTNKATGAVVVPTAIAVVNGVLEITGTFLSGQTYIVNGSLPSVWLANNISGYDATGNTTEHLVP